MTLNEKEVHWYRNDGSKPTPRRKALNRADEFDNRGQNERAKKIRSIVISKDHGDDYDARRKAKSIKVDDNKVGKLPTAAKSDKRGAIDVKHNLKKLKEVAPPAWGHTKAEKEKTNPDKPKSKIGGTAAAFKKALDDGRFKGLPGSKTKKEKTADMFKLMWAMKKKGAKPHYKPGTDEKYKKYQEETSMPNVKEKDRGAIKKRFKGLFKKDVKGTVQGVNESYEELKKKIGSKKKHDKPVTVEGISYKDFLTQAKR